jgi:hypothetical protein
MMILSGLRGYVPGAFLGVLFVERCSPNGHDESLEPARTGFARVGPFAALRSAIGGATAYLA